MFEIEDKKGYIQLNKAPIGTYEALIHPLTHNYADYLPVKIEIEDISNLIS